MERYDTYIADVKTDSNDLGGLKQYKKATITNMEKWLKPYCQFMQKSGLQEPTQLVLAQYFKESGYKLSS